MTGIKIYGKELLVLRYLALGWGNKEIAVAINRSPITVKRRIHGLLLTNGLKNRTQLALWAQREGVV